jgi:protein involved in polysaccharide export with SLBB domain
MRPLTAILVAGLVLPWGSVGAAQAQTPQLQESRLDLRRAQATRVELEASLAEIDTILNSPGYSSRLRDAKRREATLIRERLMEGDLQVGDQVVMSVLGEPTLSDTFPVSPGRVLVLPGFGEVPLRGVLRSELQDHLTRELARYLREPQVRVQSKVRIGLLGGVTRQGFYHVPADVLISDAIMMAGGLAATADPNHTVIRRAGQDLLNRDQVRDALVRGATVDQLNLRAGDEIVVDSRVARSGTGMSTAVTLVSLGATLLTTIVLLVR